MSRFHPGQDLWEPAYRHVGHVHVGRYFGHVLDAESRHVRDRLYASTTAGGSGSRGGSRQVDEPACGAPHPALRTEQADVRQPLAGRLAWGTRRGHRGEPAELAYGEDVEGCLRAERAAASFERGEASAFEQALEQAERVRAHVGRVEPEVRLGNEINVEVGGLDDDNAVVVELACYPLQDFQGLLGVQVLDYVAQEHAVHIGDVEPGQVAGGPSLAHVEAFGPQALDKLRVAFHAEDRLARGAQSPQHGALPAP